MTTKVLPGKDLKDAQILMHMLATIGRRADMSQRGLAIALGIALGATNAYLRQCLDKGFVEKTDCPIGGRTSYRLTTRGYAEKSRLTTRFLKTSLEFYQQARESCREALKPYTETDMADLYVCGTGVFAEIAFVTALEQDVRIAAFYDPESEQSTMFSRPVCRSMDQLDATGTLLFAQLNKPFEAYYHLRQEAGPRPILVPGMLKDALIMPRSNDVA